jgi:hypothetical protein
MRRGESTREQIKLLKTRTVDQVSAEDAKRFDDAEKLFQTNQEVLEYSYGKLNPMELIIPVKAIDSKTYKSK